MSGNFFRGTDRQQDSRFGNSDKRLMKRMKFAKVLGERIDIKKVNIEVMSRWITEKITEILGFEDEVVIGMCINMLDGTEALDPKQLQLNLTGFLEKQAMGFVEELWTLLADAQESQTGIPTIFLERKKAEILRQQSMDLSRSHRVMATNALLSQPAANVAPLLTTQGTGTLALPGISANSNGAAALSSPLPKNAVTTGTIDLTEQINAIRAEVSATKAERDREKVFREEERADATEAILRRREVKEMLEDKSDDDDEARLVQERLKAFEEEDNEEEKAKAEAEAPKPDSKVKENDPAGDTRSKDSKKDEDHNLDKGSKKKKDRHRYHDSESSSDNEDSSSRRRRDRERKRKKKSRRSRSRSTSRDRREKKKKGRSRSRSKDRRDRKRKERSSSREKKSSKKNDKKKEPENQDAHSSKAVKHDTPLEQKSDHSPSSESEPVKANQKEEDLRKAALQTMKDKNQDEEKDLEEERLRKAALASMKG